MNRTENNAIRGGKGGGHYVREHYRGILFGIHTLFGWPFKDTKKDSTARSPSCSSSS